MTLREALLKIDSLDTASSLFLPVRQPLSLDSTVTVVEIDKEDDKLNENAAPPDTRLLMDVSHASDVMNGLEQLLKQQLGRQPNQQELIDRFITYLKNDA